MWRQEPALVRLSWQWLFLCQTQQSRVLGVRSSPLNPDTTHRRVWGLCVSLQPVSAAHSSAYVSHSALLLCPTRMPCVVADGPFPPAGTVFSQGNHEALRGLLPTTSITHDTTYTVCGTAPAVEGSLMPCKLLGATQGLSCFLHVYVGMGCPVTLYSLTASDLSSVLPIYQFRC